MDVYLKKVQTWWQDATPKKRWSAITLAFGIICTLLFFFFSSSYQPATINSSTAAVSAADALDNPGYYLGVIAKTVGVLLLIIGGAIVLKRMQKSKVGSHPERSLEIEESIRLSPKQALHLVRVGNQFFLVGATDQNLNLISRVDQHESAEEDAQPILVNQQSFESLLADASEMKSGN